MRTKAALVGVTAAVALTIAGCGAAPSTAPSVTGIGGNGSPTSAPTDAGGSSNPTGTPTYANPSGTGGPVDPGDTAVLPTEPARLQQNLSVSIPQQDMPRISTAGFTGLTEQDLTDAFRFGAALAATAFNTSSLWAERPPGTPAILPGEAWSLRDYMTPDVAMQFSRDTVDQNTLDRNIDEVTTLYTLPEPGKKYLYPSMLYPRFAESSVTPSDVNPDTGRSDVTVSFWLTGLSAHALPDGTYAKQVVGRGIAYILRKTNNPDAPWALAVWNAGPVQWGDEQPSDTIPAGFLELPASPTGMVTQSPAPKPTSKN